MLYRYPAVEEAAVVGLLDHVYGQTIAAFVTLRPGQSMQPSGLKEFCAARLALFKILEQVTFLEQLPKDSVGKILKSELKKGG